MKSNLILKMIGIWILAIVITVVAAVFQKKTGPTYPKKYTVKLNEKNYDIFLIRSHGGETNASLELQISDTAIEGKIFYKKYPVKKDQEWNVVELKHRIVNNNQVMQGELPHQPPAGKLIYHVQLKDDAGIQDVFKNAPVVIRFKDSVPEWALLPHIIFVFFGMLLSNSAGLFAAFKLPQQKLYSTITLILFLIGGMILGPIVQKYAFGEYWTGVPFGWDLTDNKMLIAFIAWIIAFFGNKNKERCFLTVIAAVITIVIFSIPHSMYGSELNRETGDVIQGIISIF